MSPANNVTRMLAARHVPFQAYDLPDGKLGARQVAELLGVPPAHVFKTIVVSRDKPRGPVLVLVPGDCEVDLRLVATAMGEKRVHLPSEREAERLTGLQAGGISPLALINRGFRVLIDSSAQEIAEIHVSGGERGLNLRLRPADLAQLTNARFADVAASAQHSG